ncbi:MAG: threonylcarbamoyl-AMP synthase [Rhodocyclales bacterium]|nr:threonylcarbamoyl-AMP synthase [Rhodocyclales bacterium]
MSDVSRAAAMLRAGDLVAFPTETVYGLGADAGNAAAVARVFAAKGRPADHPLIVHLPDAGHLDRWAIDIPQAARKLAAAFWPGPLTLILKRHPSVIDAITGGQETVGLRVPRHPLALQLLREFDGGVAAPSANRFGHVSPTTAAHVRDELGAAVGMVLDGGPCQVGIESTILDLSSGAPRILRPGMLDAVALAEVLGTAPTSGAEGAAPRVSGSLESHYAPTTPMRLVAESAMAQALAAALGHDQRVAVFASLRPETGDSKLIWRQASRDPAAYAHDLYARLREFDTLGCDLILVAAPPVDEAWRAVNDRLQRAAAEAK